MRFRSHCRGQGHQVLAFVSRFNARDRLGSLWLDADDAGLGGLNAQMFNSFLDGTKSAIEMCAVSNATGLIAPDGLLFPPCGVDELPQVMRPHTDGGVLRHRGQVEVISSLRRDGASVDAT